MAASTASNSLLRLTAGESWLCFGIILFAFFNMLVGNLFSAHFLILMLAAVMINIITRLMREMQALNSKIEALEDRGEIDIADANDE